MAQDSVAKVEAIQTRISKKERKTMKNAAILATMFALAIGASAQSRSKVPPSAHVPPVAHTASRSVSSSAKTAARPSALPGPRAVNGGKRK